MATASVEITRLMFAPGPKPGLEVELSLRPEYADERLSPRELEVLSPVLPELIGELLTMCQDKFGE
jgi:hypothetical protein